MENKIENIISQNLIELRKNRGLKQSDLSEAIGYSDKTISRWENGTSIPDVATLVKLTEFYGVTISDIINENAALKATDGDRFVQEQHERVIKTFSNLSLAVLTVWLLAIFIYLGSIVMKVSPLWESFVLAIPISAYLSYRNVNKMYNIKWLNLLLLTVIVFSLLTFVFLIIFLRRNENFWYIYLLSIPLEGMCVINTLFKKKSKKK